MSEPEPSDVLAAPLTPDELALLRESTDPQYRRLPMPERALVARLLAAKGAGAPPSPAVDVERLAKAIQAVEWPAGAWSNRLLTDRYREQAAAIAREYDRLASGPAPAKAGEP